jgi:hypothetical protein
MVKIMDPFKEAKEGYKNTKPWDLLNSSTEFVNKNILRERLDVCESCPKFIKLTKQCKICMCIMPAKAMMADSFCPLHKWQAVTPDSKEMEKNNGL